MALTVIAESVASVIIGNVVNTCSSYLMAYRAVGGTQDELKRLQDALPQVQAVLTAVEECELNMAQNKGLEKWLWQLRDAVEYAEDVLDLLDYYKLEKRIQDGDGKVRGNILSKCKKMIDSFINRISGNDTLERLREAVKVLNKVIDSMTPFLQIAIGFNGPSIKRRKFEKVKNARETSCLLTESEVFGRDKERDTIVEWLIKPVDGESERITFNVSAYSIVGMGGLGKTTLAQLIHQDERVQRYFDSIMWVCISQEFNATTITRNIVEEINHKSSDHMHSLNALHKDLKEKLTSKKFLLILDDVWDGDNMTEWEKLVAPLKFGQRGSKILLTTRTDLVVDMAAKVMKCKRESLNLNELEESDCMSLFNWHAFLGVNPDDYKNLQPIGKQIVKKLGGCPLAIKVMGGLLNSSMDYDYWKRILKKDTMIVQQRENDIRKVLKLSYDHLPICLQVCFRYCSIFPQHYEFEGKELVYMWMGSGLICSKEKNPEDVGREYLDLLTRNSFFTCKSIYDKGKIYKHYVMHDLLHDLAQSISQEECNRITDDVGENTIPQTVRHLSIEIINLLSIKRISHLKNLRTLVIYVKKDQEHNIDRLLMFNEVIKGFKNLRLLRMSGSFDFYKMRDALHSSVHLRYLSLQSYVTPIGGITEFLRLSVYRLYHLQFLNLFHNEITNPAATDIIEWDGLTNLVNLRSLRVPYGMERKIPYVSKLPFICQLNNFFVGDKSGYKISELKNLSNLGDHLGIRGLENVRTSEEAMEAKLNEKEYLKSLTLEWSEGLSNSVEMDEQLLDNLCPHINLKSLCILEYQGVNSPRWMSDLSLINNLTSIELIYCKGWEHLPPLGQLPFLNHLKLSGLHTVKKIDSLFFGSSRGCAFPSLKEVVFENLPNLEEWIGIDDGCMFPKLHKMEITRCPNLMGILTRPRSLRELSIDNAGLTALQVINQDCGNNNQEYFKALESLDIRQCEKLEYIPTLPRSLRELRIYNAGLTALQVINQDCGNSNQEYFKALKNLYIGQCEKLEYVPPEFFWKSNPLRYLDIVKCPKLTTRGISDIQLPSTLHRIFIGSCGDLEEPLLRLLPNSTSFTWLELCDCASITSLLTAQVCARWTMLSHLEIRNCKELSSLGGIQALVSLRWLLIRGCDKLIEVAGLEAPFPNDVGQENAADCFLKLGSLSIDHHALLLMEPLRSLSSISSFNIFDASRLTSLPEEWLLQNHSALKKLDIRNAVSLQSLPQTMAQLCSLESLKVGNAKLIQSLPDLPTSLRTLWITGCHPELKERCQENIGLDWPKIANIPDVDVRIELKYSKDYY